MTNADNSETEFSIDAALVLLPKGWRFHVGHVPHWYQRDELPKQLRKKPFEAYVCNGGRIGTRGYVFESADAATPASALRLAINRAIEVSLAKDHSLSESEKR